MTQTTPAHHVSLMRRTTTFLFTDIVGSTEMLTLLGEETWLRALREHNAVVLDVVERVGGTMLKFLGDGWMVTFACPRGAVDAAVAIQNAHERGATPDGFSIRIGVHSGYALEEALPGEYIGKDVVLASRIAQEGGPGEIVVSAEIVDVLGPSDDRFDGGRIAHLKGLGPHLVFGVHWRPEERARSPRTMEA